VPKSVDQFVCCCCGESLSNDKFYRSNSNFYTNGILPICKNCFVRKFSEYAKTYMSNKKAMQRMCMAFDVYFNEDVFDKCDTKDDAVVGKYFRHLNLGQHKEKNFDSSLDEGIFELSGDRKRVKGKRVAIVDEYDNVQEETENLKINPKDIEKWGIGFDVLDYEVLNTHYKTLTKANPNIDNNQEIFIYDLCYIKAQQMKALRENRLDDYNKMTDSYRKTFQQSGIKMVKENGSVEDFSYGENISRIEKYCPSEVYRNQALYKDFEGIGSYFKRIILRPLKNLEYGTTDRDEEFCVHDQDDSEDYDDNG